MICPHCGVGIAIDYYDSMSLDNENGKQFEVRGDLCPVCDELILKLEIHYEDAQKPTADRIIYPPAYSRQVEAEVPDNYKNDFIETCNVLPISPKSSAALSRRLLQQILREEYAIKHRSLAQEIDDFISNADVPSHVKDAVDAVRNVGNFAAHPLKDTNTGQIVDVEPGEAEWLIDVLEALYDVTFVQPKRLEERMKKLNGKLNSLGKPPMKKS